MPTLRSLLPLLVGVGLSCSIAGCGDGDEAAGKAGNDPGIPSAAGTGDANGPDDSNGAGDANGAGSGRPADVASGENADGENPAGAGDTPEGSPNAPPSEPTAAKPDDAPGDAEPVDPSQVDPALPDYKAVPGISGTIKSEGSDTMNNLMSLWTEGFRKFYPNVREEIVGKGSSTAMPALISGTATFGPMSRAAKADEIDEFERRFGYKPTQLGTSIDMLAVYVHKDNPLAGLSLDQCDAIFSQNRKRGFPNDVTKWGQVGTRGALENQPISLYGRNSASGTYGFFKEAALAGGDFKATVKEQPGSSAVVQGVGSDKSGIGYSGIGYDSPNVRALPLSLKSGNNRHVAPTAENVDDYPLTRFLYLTVNHEPNSELPPLQREFVKYVLSKQGQLDVVKDHYVPVPAGVAKQELARVGIE